MIKVQEYIEAEIVHVFEYYDQPLVYVMKTLCGRLLLHYYINKEGDWEKVFLYDITETELRDIMERKLGFKDSLMNTFEKNKLFYFYEALDNHYHKKFELVTKENFDESAMPTNNFFAEYDYLTDTDLEKKDFE